MKALIINKIGDVSLLLGIILIFGIFNSLDFSLINCSIWGLNLYYILNLKITLIYINLDLCTLSILLIIIGVAAKSAQIGLHI